MSLLLFFRISELRKKSLGNNFQIIRILDYMYKVVILIFLCKIRFFKLLYRRKVKGVMIKIIYC